MLLDLKARNTDLRNVIRSLLGMPDGSVRPANDNAPAGDTAQYVTVLLSADGSAGRDDKSYVTDGNNVLENITGQRKLTASIQFIRGDALSKAARLPGLLQSSKAAGLLQALGLGFVRAGVLTNLSAVWNTIWEERAQMEVEFYCISDEQVSVPTYGTFPVSVNSDNS